MTYKRKRVKKKFFVLWSLVIIVNMIISMFLPTSSVFASGKNKNILKNNNLDVDIIVSKDDKEISDGVVTSGDEITFGVKYSINGGQGAIKEGDTLEFKLPKEFEDLKPKVPPEHFKSYKVVKTPEGQIVKAVFSDNAKTAIGGYISIKSKVGNVNKDTPVRVEAKINGVTKYLDIDVKPQPKPDENPDDKPGGGEKPTPTPVIDRQLLKTIYGQYGYEDGKAVANINKPVVGKIQKYIVDVNEEYAEMINAKFCDKMPAGTKLLPDSIEIYESDRYTSKNVTEKLINKEAAEANEVNINFGNTDKHYQIMYSIEYTQYYDKYENTALLYQDNKNPIKSSAVVTPVQDNTMISKNYTSGNTDKNNNYVVSNVGDTVDYTVDVNPNNADMKNAVFEDKFPAGMELVKGTITIDGWNIKGEGKHITTKAEVKDNGFSVNLGNTNYRYCIRYKLKVTERNKEYNNEAKIVYNGKSQDVDSKISYELNAGAINAQKLVDKTEIKKGDNNLVVYEINIDCYGYFNANYLNIIDNLDSRLKVVGVEVPQGFTANTEGNKILIKNNKSINYGENFKIKIKTDFSGVPNGTTIENIAKINCCTTNKVETKKGFSFEGKKIDSYTKDSLEGAKFDLLDKDKKLIKTITSDSKGEIKSDVDNSGDYYLKEVEAPKGYKLDSTEKKFTIKDDDIGTVVNIGNIENNIKTGSLVIIKEDSESKDKLQGAEFKVYSSDNKEIGSYITNNEGKIIVDNLRPGKYYFEEIQAPKGYSLDNSKHDFEIKLGETENPVTCTIDNNIEKGKAIVVKEDIETGKKLQGAIYGLYDLNNNLIEKVTTDENGEGIASTKLRPGKYYFKEIEAPKGYNISDEKLPIEIKLGGVTDKPEVIAKDSIILGSAKLIKVDSKTGKKLSGAVYGVYDSNNKLIEKITTGTSGEVSTKTDLRPGKYYFEEITAPFGYNLNLNKYPFEIILGEIEKVPEIIAKDEVILGSVNLIKEDSETGEKLQGAEFDLYKVKENLNSGFLNRIKGLINEKSEKLGSYTTDENGKINVENLSPGNYYFLETKAPEGYNIDSSKREFKIKLGENSSPITIIAKNDIKKGEAVVVKEDIETGSKLKGAVYGLYDSNNNLIEKVRTDENGQAIANTKLRPGKYYFKEIEAPKGYKISSEKLPIEIKVGGIADKNEVIAKDAVILGSAKLIKVDSKTGNKLNGAVYGIYDSDNKLIEKVTTGSSGEVSTKTDLRPGKYYFQEITAPIGYNLNQSKYPFEIVLGETDKVPEVIAKDDVTLGSAKLIKEDNKTGEKLKDAIYGVYDSNDELVEKVTTEENGEVSTKTDLRPGKYYFKEIEAPLGYEVNNEKYPFEIILGEAEKVPEVIAKDKVSLASASLIKEDSETGEKLQGAEFKLYSSDNKEMGTFATDKDGKLTVDNLRPGSYYFVETKAPEGYNIDSSKHEFEVKLGEANKDIEVIAKDNVKKGSISLIKEDSETGEKLQGATFDLYKVNEKSVVENKLLNTIKNLITPESKKIGSYTTDKNGLITVGDLRPGNYYFIETKAPEGYNLDTSKNSVSVILGETDKTKVITVRDNIKKGKAILVKEDSYTGEKLQGAIYGLYDSNDKLIEKVTTDENGQAITNTKLRPGKYYFKEITPPIGYKMSDKKLDVKVSSGGIVNPETVVAKDAVVLGSAKLIKVDSQNGGGLQGAVYGIYDSNNKLIEKVTTGKNGEVKTKTDLRPGKYYFEEITAPIGYNVNSEKYPFEVTLGETDKVPEVTVKDDVILSSVSLIKEDSETGEKLQGAEFKLYSSDNKEMGTFVTDKDGKLTVDNLRPGSYYFVETKAPEGYKVDSLKHEFDIKLGEANKIITVTVKDNIEKGVVNLTKEDSETGEKLQGAEFKLYSSDNKEIGAFTTDKDGKLTVDSLRPGSYYFIETKAPDGYNLDYSKHEFEVKLGEVNKIIEITAKDDIKKGEAVVIKEDIETGEKLKDAVYGLYDSNDKLIEKVTTDENGEGIVNTKIRPGNYYFQEIAAPSGYNLSNEKLPIEIKLGGIADKTEVIAKDSVILGSAKLIKKDTETGEKLQGAIYGVYNLNDKLIEKVTTGKDGEVITKTDLRPGKYYFKEIKAPLGYNVNENEYPFEVILGETEKIPEITAKDNVILSSASLIKEDSEIGEKLQGAEFKLYSLDNKEIGTFVTNKDGKLTVDNLRPGSYYFVETKAPIGYSLDSSKHEFNIKLGEVNKAIILTVKDNIEKGVVNLTKEDSETGEKLQAAEFKLYSSDNREIGAFTTNKDGKLTVDNLRPGSYYFVETKAPEGYNLDSSKHEFEVKLGEAKKTIEITAKDDIKKGEAILVKEDIATGEKLKGAVYGLYDSNNKLIEKVTTDENGQAIGNTKLRPGNYYFKEITSPVGYKMSDKKLDVKVSSGGIVNPETVVAKDAVILGSAKLIKLDSKTGSKLSGAVYGIYDSNNKLIEKVTTGTSGEVSTKTDLRPGKYYFKEITAPTGYNVNSEEYPFEIILGETTKIPEITAKDDVILSSVNLIKEDSETGEKLQGAEFKLYSSDNKEMGSFTTNKDGELTVDNLRPGSYYFVETKAPEGYNLDSSKHEFEIKLGENENIESIVVKDIKINEKVEENSSNKNTPNNNSSNKKNRNKIKEIVNNILPKTGYESYYPVAMILIILGIVLIILKKKNNKRND